MASPAEQAYLESRILCADGIELVRILYQAALESVERARRFLRQGDIAGRSKAISRASAILAELALSLNHGAEASLSRNLVELYDYMQRRLTAAHLHQVEPPLAEVARLLGTLLEGWLNCVAAAQPWAEAPHPPELEPEYASQSWSL